MRELAREENSKKNADNKNTNDRYKNASEEVKAIKSDIQDLVKRLGNLKGEALSAINDESGQLMDTLSDMKDKAVKGTQNSMQSVSTYVSKSPIQSLLYTLGVGILLGVLLKK